MALYLRSLSAVRIANHGCFCTGIEHAQAITDELRQHDITAECVTGDSAARTSADILKRFKLGDIRAVVNVAVLTTGFDAPNIDLIAMLRPTESPALYIQMSWAWLAPVKNIAPTV